MKFVDTRVQAEWESASLSPVVKRIVEDAAAYALDTWGWEFTVTSIYRTPAEDAALRASGVHSAWRAVDVRTRDQSAEAVRDVTAYANGRWAYDPQRPKMQVCFSEPHGSGPHAHFQSHPRTAEKS